MLIFWQVASKPVGRYRSFKKRNWPTGWSDSRQTFPIAMILCADEYIPAKVRKGEHAPLKVAVAIKNTDLTKAAFNWRTLRGEFANLQAAKDAAKAFYKEHSDMFLTSRSSSE